MIKILVTNDDGIDAHGLRCMVEALGKIADVYVVAPSEQQSGKSMSITFRREVHAEERELKGAIEAYALDGTPTDCIIWGLGILREEGIVPDYVFSGINMGHNLGAAAYYSGTMAGAREGAISGIRSVALSVGDHNATHFDYVLGLLPRLIEMSSSIDPSIILSVNGPDLPSWDIKGVKAVPAAPHGYRINFLFGRAESGDYQMKPVLTPKDGHKRYDIDWMDEGYVTISPIPTGLRDPASLMVLNGQTLQTDCLTLIIDAQTETPGRIKKANRFRTNIEKLIHSVSRMGRPVIIAESYDKGELLPELAPYTKEAETVRHIHPDVWTSPDMEKLVTAADCRKVLIAGASTNTEILQTVPGFIRKGYEVVIIEDCCAASDKLSNKLAIEMLREYGCRISTLETEVMELAGGCTKPVLESVRSILEN